MCFNLALNFSVTIGSSVHDYTGHRKISYLVVGYIECVLNEFVCKFYTEKVTIYLVKTVICSID